MWKVNNCGLTLSCCPWLKHRVSSSSRRRRENKTPSRTPSHRNLLVSRLPDGRSRKLLHSSICRRACSPLTLPGRAADRFGSPGCDDPAMKHQEAPGSRVYARARSRPCISVGLWVQKWTRRHYLLALMLFHTCVSFLLLWNTKWVGRRNYSLSLYSHSLNGKRCNGIEWWLSLNTITLTTYYTLSVFVFHRRGKVIMNRNKISKCHFWVNCPFNCIFQSIFFACMHRHVYSTDDSLHTMHAFMVPKYLLYIITSWNVPEEECEHIYDV